MTTELFIYESALTECMRGFSDEQRKEIHTQLIDTGRELLMTYGPKKTNVADITEPVGIAKSTFYLFFDSKADLYLEIVHREQQAFEQKLATELADIEEPKQGLKVLFQLYREFAETNPLMQQLLLDDTALQSIRSGASQERFEALQQQSLEEIIPYIEAFQEQSSGLIAEHDPTAILGVMSTIGLMVVHKSEYTEFDEDYYDRVQALLIEALAIGLTTNDPE